MYEYNIWELLSALSRIFLYGVLDNNLRLDEWTKVATQRHLLMTCNVIAASCFKLLKSLGYKTRVVGLYNSQNVKHGHSLNEVLIDHHYILVDFTKKAFVCDIQGNGVSLRDVIEMGGFSSCQLKPLSWHSLSSDSGMGVEISANGQVFNSCFASDFYSLAYPLHLKRWFEAFDLFMLSDNPMYEMCILEQEKTARKYCEFSETKYYKFLDANAFFSRFYGEN